MILENKCLFKQLKQIKKFIVKIFKILKCNKISVKYYSFKRMCCNQIKNIIAFINKAENTVMLYLILEIFKKRINGGNGLNSLIF